MFYGRRRRFANPNPNRRGRFPKPNRRDRLPNSIRDKKGGYSDFDEFGVLSFDGNLDVKSILLWIEEVDKLFGIKYFFMEDHVKFVTYKFNKRAAVW